MKIVNQTLCMNWTYDAFFPSQGLLINDANHVGQDFFSSVHSKSSKNADYCSEDKVCKRFSRDLSIMRSSDWSDL